jgi:chromosome segregation ATPase
MSLTEQQRRDLTQKMKKMESNVQEVRGILASLEARKAEIKKGITKCEVMLHGGQRLIEEIQAILANEEQGGKQ